MYIFVHVRQYHDRDAAACNLNLIFGNLLAVDPNPPPRVRPDFLALRKFRITLTAGNGGVIFRSQAALCASNVPIVVEQGTKASECASYYQVHTATVHV